MSQLPSTQERIPLEIFPESKDANRAVAREIAELIRAKADAGQQCVLGLATGSTPTGVYAELIRLHRDEQLSFQNVVTFNLDEYFPMQPRELQSYVRFMNEQLFKHIDIKPENVNIPDGTLDRAAVNAFCAAYEAKIKALGGIDLQILGIGRTGHIGFNEPGSGRDSRTRLITLDKVTRLDAASDFFGDENVPRRAITMGVGTILDAKRVILLAFGEHKAGIVARAVEEPVTDVVAASFLQTHPNAVFVLDQAAAGQLTRHKFPWLVGPVEWTPALKKQAVIWLARLLNKPILKLVDEDYNEHGLQDLLAENQGAYEINIDVFRMLQQTITG